MPSPRVLANLPLPQPEGFTLHHFGEFIDGSSKVRSLPWQPRSERRSLKDILSRIPAEAYPDILLIRSPEYLPLPPDLESFRGLKVLILTDWNVGLRFLPALCRAFDIVFTDAVGADLLRRAGQGHVHAAALYGHDAQTLRPRQAPRDIDLSFCGNLNGGMHRARNQVLARLMPLRERRRLHLRQAFGADYLDVLSRSRLVFNYSIRGEANMRLYEAMACGAVPVIEPGNVEAPLLFEAGRHFATYDPEKPVAALEALLEDPLRLEAMSQAAQAAVQAQTQDKQLARMLHEALKLTSQPPATASASSAFNATESPHTPPEAWRSLMTLRVLGTGYTLRESIEEMQNAGSSDRELRRRVFPGLLLSLMEKDKGRTEGSPLLMRWVREALADPDLPRPIASLHALGLAVAEGRPETILEAAETLRRDASRMEMPVPETWYRHLLAPADLAKALSADVNQAYRRRLEGRDRQAGEALRDLLLAHAHLRKAEALAQLRQWDKAREEALAIEPGRHASANPHPVLAQAAIALNDLPGLHAVCRRWQDENPLDVRTWSAIAEALAAVGSEESLGRYLREWVILSRSFLREGVPPSLGEFARHHGIDA